MLKLKIVIDPDTQQEVLHTPYTGKKLLTTPQLNKGTAFTLEERIELKILGKLPDKIETLAEQTNRVYQQYETYDDNLGRYIYLNTLHDTNQVLFYSLVSQHIRTIMPIIYTPTVSRAVKAFSKKFRRSRGLYISYLHADRIEQILDNRSNPEIDIIVVTDGEGVLGIGDQGICAMDIPVAKLMVYTLCGGIDPCRTLPITLDVGTNNPDLINDDLYLGVSTPRITGEAYDQFIDRFISAVQRKFPNVLLHWEDFGRTNGRRLLKKYQDQLCTFNDDIQGTGAATLAAIMAGITYKKESLTDQRIVIFGAGNAGMGIAHEIKNALQRLGLSDQEAKERLWLIDRYGLLLDDQDLNQGQQEYAREASAYTAWAQDGTVSFERVISEVKPSILIGCSAQPGAFSEKIIREMTNHCKHPIILPLSNPVELSEATPEQLLTWTDTNALIATGSPFDPVILPQGRFEIPQCNNALVFPGIGLGVCVSKAKRISEDMVWEATRALSELAPIHRDDNANGLLPTIDNTQSVAKHIALAVAEQAIKEGHAQPQNNLADAIEHYFWHPRYLPFKLDGDE